MKLVVTFTSAALFVVATALPALAITLTLRPTVQVNQANLTVGDLVTSDSPMPEPIAVLPLGAAPNLAQHATIDREQIENAIQNNRPDLAPVTWLGADQCIVERIARSVTPDSLAGAILPELQNATNHKGDIKIEEFAPANPVLLPAGQIGAEIELPTTALYHPWIIANVIYYVNGQRMATSSVRFRWSWTLQAWQASRNINTGEDYNPVDFHLATIDAIKANGSYLTELPEAGDSSIGQRIGEGTLLAKSNLVPKKIIQRGETVMVNYVQSNFKVSMRGVALQDGCRGQVISVLNTSSQKDLFAKVIDGSTLEIVQ